MAPLTGRCLCGAVTFAVDGAPLKVVHCHCESCRRATSSPITTFVIVKRADVRYTRGAPATYASSPGVQRSFCGSCGSPLAYESAQRADMVDLYACSLSDPAAIVPEAHVHIDEQLPWLETHDDLPRHVRSTREPPLRRGPRPAR